MTPAAAMAASFRLRCGDCYVVDEVGGPTIESTPGEQEEGLVEPGDGRTARPRTLWPVGVGVGLAIAVLGLFTSPGVILPIGVVVALVFGFLWVRFVTADYRTAPVAVEPERRAPASRRCRRFPRRRSSASRAAGSSRGRCWASAA